MAGRKQDILPQGRFQQQADFDASEAPEELPRKRQRWIGAALLLAAISLAALWPTLRGEMYRPDRIMLSSHAALDRTILDPTPPGLDGWEPRGNAFTRFAAAASPARYLLRLEQGSFGRGSPRDYRLVGILLYAACAIALFAVVQRLSLPWPWLTAALFAAAPIAAGAVASIASQPNLLANLLGLLATLVYFRLSGIDRREAQPYFRISLPVSRWKLTFLAGALLIAAMLSHPSAAVLPLAWAVLTAWRLGRPPTWTQGVGLLALSSAGLAYGAALQIAYTGETIRTLLSALPHRISLLPAAGLLAIRAGMLPSGPTLLYPQLSTAPPWLLIAGAAVLLAGLAGIWITRSQSTPASNWPAGAIAGVVTFAMLVVGAVACASRAIGEYGVTDANLCLTAVLPISIVSLAIHAIVRRLGLPDLNGLTSWRHRALKYGLVGAAVVVLCGGTSYRATGFGNELAVWRQSAGRFPGAIRPVENLVILDTAAGRLADAEAGVAKLIARTPDNLAMRIRLGQLFERHGRLIDAIEAYRGANRVEPSHPAPFEHLGDVLLQRGRPDTAEAAYRQSIDLAIKRGQPSAGAYDKLGLLLTRQKRFEDAAASFEKAIALEPDRAVSHMGIAQVRFAQGDFERSATHVRDALEREPNNTDTLTTVGLMLAKLGDKENAQKIFRRALQLNPDSPIAINNLGTALAVLGRFDEAMYFFRRAASLDPANAMANANLVQAQRGKEAKLTSPVAKGDDVR